MKDASRFFTIRAAISAGIPSAIISGGREWFCVGILRAHECRVMRRVFRKAVPGT